MPQTQSERDIVELLADEFVAKHRRGERPSLAEFADRCPERADEIRELFPALIVMERLKPASGSSGRATDPIPTVTPDRLGDYRILREVGRGGMGVVYEAEQISLGRHVAVKVLSASRRIDARTRLRFEREAKAAARLHHTNIVPVFGVGEHEGVSYYVMQFINGLAVDQVIEELRRLRENGTLPSVPPTGDDLSAAAVVHSLIAGGFNPGPRAAFAETITVDLTAAGRNTQQLTAAAPVRLPGADASGQSNPSRPRYWQSIARLGVQVAEALAYAHGQGVLHRDIKPSNLLFDAEGTVWVADFGMAKADDQANLTETGDLLGTMRYMPPEAFDGKADARGDVYSLGLTLYELLAFRPAFDEVDRSRLIRQVTTAEPSPLRRLNRSIPVDFATIVHKAIDRDPARRYPSAAALADDLKSLLADQPIRARRVSDLEKAWRWCRRNPAVSSLGAAVVLLLVLMTAGSLWFAAWRGQQLEVTGRAKDQEAASRKDAFELLRGSYFNQARADRWSGRLGRRFLALDALAKAMQIESDKSPTLLELRNEAIANLALVDISSKPVWTGNILVDGIAFSPNFEHYATWARHVGAVIVYRRNEDRDGEEVARFPALKESIWPVRFSPDGRYLAFGSRGTDADGEQRHWLEVWDWQRGALMLKAGHAPVGSMGMAFSPDSLRIAATWHRTESFLYDIVGGRELGQFSGGGVVSFHPNGQSLALVNGRTIEFRNVETGLPSAKPLVVPGVVFDARWSPDGTLFAVASKNKLAYIYDANSGELRTTLIGHKWQVNCVLFSPDGQLLYTTDWGKALRVWETHSGRALADGWAERFSLSRDGRHIGHGKGDRAGIYETAGGSIYNEMHGHTCDLGPDEAQFASDGSFVASAGSDGVRLWEPSSSKHLAYVPANGRRVRLSPNGNALVCLDESGLQRWPIQRDLVARVLRIGPPQILLDRPFTGLNMSRDGQWFALVDRSRGQVDVRPNADPTKGRAFTDLPEVNGATFSPDNRWLVAGGWQAPWAKVFDLTSGNCVHDFRVKLSVDWSFSPDGKWLAIGNVEGGRLWEVGTWKPGPEIPEFRGSRSVGQMQFSPDGSILAVTRPGPVVQLLKFETLEELCTLEASGLPAFSPDGSQLAVPVGGTRVIEHRDLRRIREQLKPMGLDWPMPEYRPAEKAPQGWSVEVVAK